MIDWKTVAVRQDATLGDAISCIDASAQQVALVLAPDGTLAGLLTDGDVRRALLRGLGMNAPVVDAMNASPTSAQTGSSREQLLAEMRRRSIRHMPLVDAAGIVVGLATEHDLSGVPKRANWVVLMAGGLGSRLAPLTDDCPKPMLKVGDKPLLQTILERFIDDGFHRFYISVNYRAEMVRDHFGDGAKWGVEIVYLQETQRLGTAGALGLISDVPDEPVIVMNGDLLTKVNFQQLLDFHTHHAAAGTMGVREYDIQVPFGVVSIDGHRIASIDEKPVHHFFVNAGIYVISPDTLRLIPSGQFFDMPTLFSQLLDMGRETAVFPVREYWLDIGHLADYHRANGEYAELFA
ncbi:MAG: nucleotidyltransferase family protein [Sphingomonas sp.]